MGEKALQDSTNPLQAEKTSGPLLFQPACRTSLLRLAVKETKDDQKSFSSVGPLRRTGAELVLARQGQVEP